MGECVSQHSRWSSIRGAEVRPTVLKYWYDFILHSNKTLLQSQHEPNTSINITEHSAGSDYPLNKLPDVTTDRPAHCTCSHTVEKTLTATFFVIVHSGMQGAVVSLDPLESKGHGGLASWLDLVFSFV